MDKPMAALRKCTDELVEHWGLDAEAQRHLTRKAAPASDPGTWISSEEYPSNLLARGVQGLVQFRMIVNAEGHPTSCTIQQSTRPVEFDETVCRVLMRRARFDPALDAQGKPITSYWRSTVHFMIG
jgi:TonB family protein